jgi:hypothetical protein
MTGIMVEARQPTRTSGGLLTRKREDSSSSFGVTACHDEGRYLNANVISKPLRAAFFRSGGGAIANPLSFTITRRFHSRIFASGAQKHLLIC